MCKNLAYVCVCNTHTYISTLSILNIHTYPNRNNVVSSYEHIPKCVNLCPLKNVMLSVENF